MTCDVNKENQCKIFISIIVCRAAFDKDQAAKIQTVFIIIQLRIDNNVIGVKKHVLSTCPFAPAYFPTIYNLIVNEDHYVDNNLNIILSVLLSTLSITPLAFSAPAAAPGSMIIHEVLQSNK